MPWPSFSETMYAYEPTVRMSRVGGAMVNVLSTARIEKQLERNRRRTERFERKMAELQRHEKEVSDKLKDAQVSRSDRNPAQVLANLG